MDYLNLLVDKKREFTIYLIQNLYKEIHMGIYSIYNSCKNENDLNTLQLFQKFLAEIPNWSTKIIYNETQRILKNIDYLEDLITAVYISNIRMLCSLKTKDKKMKIKIPKIDTFIHKCYIEAAKELWLSTYLFDESKDSLKIQKNKRKIIDIIKFSIEEVIRKSLPIRTILKDYLETNLDTLENPGNINENLFNIIQSKNLEENKQPVQNIQNIQNIEDIENVQDIHNSQNINSEKKININNDSILSMVSQKNNLSNNIDLNNNEDLSKIFSENIIDFNLIDNPDCLFNK